MRGVLASRGKSLGRQSLADRRRGLCLAAACAGLCLIGFSAVRGLADVSEISSSSTDPNASPQINNNGLVAWTGTSSGQAAVYLWNNATPQFLGNTTLFDTQPNFSLSNSGQVVWQYQVNPPVGQDLVAGSEIFLWDGTGVSQLSPHTSGEGHVYPTINSNNGVAWVRVYYPTANQSRLSFDIQVWNGSVSQVTNSYVPKTNLHINDNGRVVWQQADAYNQIYLWDADHGIRRLSDGTANSINPRISNSNQVVWQQYDTVPNQQGTNHYQIYLWDGTIRPLTNDSADNTDPQINSSNQVVWVQHGDPTLGTPSNVYRWIGWAQQVSPNTSYNGEVSAPRIVDQGFIGWTQGPPPLLPGLSTIYVWNGGNEIQAVDTSAMLAPPMFNWEPQIVYLGDDSTTHTCEVKFYQPVPPAPPSNLTATASASNQVNLTWADNSDNETLFSVWRSTTGADGPFSRQATLVPNTTSWSDTMVAPSTTYWYEVRAADSAGASAFSNVATATTPAS